MKRVGMLSSEELSDVLEALASRRVGIETTKDVLLQEGQDPESLSVARLESRAKRLRELEKLFSKARES